jgi:hypothetical protein
MTQIFTQTVSNQQAENLAALEFYTQTTPEPAMTSIRHFRDQRITRRQFLPAQCHPDGA